MKFTNLCFFVIMQIPMALHAGLFGASSYEECVLENLKNAKTDVAVNTVHAMCSTKFSKEKSSKENGVKICKLYWNGWELKVNDKVMENNKFTIYEFGKNDLKTLEITLPNEMFKNNSNKEKAAEGFYNEHAYEVRRLCSLK